MKTSLRFFGLLTAIAVNCVCVQAEPAADKTEQTGYRLTAELKDGSRVIGKCRDQNLQFRSDSLGEMKLPLEKVRSIEAAKASQVKLITANADSLMVEMTMKDIRVETAFGDVRLPVSMIKSLRVSSIGKGRPTDGLIGFWPGNGNAEDSAGGNNGVNQNVTYTDGVAGHAFSFSPNEIGAHVCINVADEPAYVFTHSLSIDAWIRPRGDGNVVLTRGDRRPGMDPYTISMDGHHKVIFQITDDDGQNAVVEADRIPYGEWTHVAATLDGDSGMIRLYTNGMMAAEKETSVRPIGELIPNLTPGIGIGNVNDGMNNFPFVGDIAEVALYSRALSAREVKAIYAEHAATAGGKAELLPGPGQANFHFRNGLRPGVQVN